MFLTKLPIRKQMFLIAILSLASVVGLLLFNYKQTTRLVTEKNESYTNEIFIQIEQTLDSNHEVIKWLAYNIGYNQTVQDLLLSDPEELPEKLDTYKQINNLLFHLSTVNSGVLDFVIIGRNGAKLSLNSGLSDIESFDSSVSDTNIPSFSGVKECFAGVPRKKTCLVVGTTVFSSVIYDRYTEKIGTVYLLIDPVMLSGGRGLETIEEASETLLLDRNGKVFLATDPARIGQTFDIVQMASDKAGQIRLDGKLMHIQVGELPQIHGKIIRFIPDQVFYRDVRLLRRWSLMAIVIGVTLLSVPFFLIVNNLISPLHTLYFYMKIKKTEDLKKAIELRGSKEAEAIGKQFNQMMQRITELTGELVDSKEKLLNSEIEKKQAEYKFLKSQVNPHFLYNTLDSIRGIALDRQVPEINEVTKALSQIFRYSVKGNEYVTFKEELDIITAYVQIQSVRFPNRFEFILDVDRRFWLCRIPKMILQPIVENAVYHGLEPRYHSGMLTMSAWEDSAGNLYIRIADNGAGIPEEEVIRLNARFSRGPGESGSEETGIGLVNVDNRLKFIFGKEYGLHLCSIVDQGTDVVLKLPLRREDNGHV